MTTIRAPRVTICATLCVLGALHCIAPAHALPVDQYLKLRRTSGCDPRLTYAQVEGAPTVYLNRVLELRGTVDGSIRREQDLSFLLTIAEKRSLLLNAPAADINLVNNSNHQAVRVLARVTQSAAAGNIIPLQVLGIAYDGEVTLREREAEAAIQAQAASRPQIVQRLAQRQRGKSPSRGYYARAMQSAGDSMSLGDYGSRISPEAQSIYPAYYSFISHHNPRLSDGELDAITAGILYNAQRYGVDPRIVVAVIIAESDFDPRCTSHKGAMGLGQIMPDEARALHMTNPYDPFENVSACVALLREKLDRYSYARTSDGDISVQQLQLALAAYNAGPGAVKKYRGVPPYRETQNYIKRILKQLEVLLGKKSNG